MKIGIISLGCPRNLVDSEVMMGILEDKGYSVTDEITGSDIAIVNTCAFIKDAVDESIDTILSLIDLKKRGNIKHIIVTGCLPQRYKGKLDKELKEIDGFVGTGDIGAIAVVAEDILNGKKRFDVSETPEFIYSHLNKRFPISLPHYMYVKIQEGCANGCSYCVIPALRGRLRSRSMDSILNEIKGFSDSRRISELNIIGQDTTSYGFDLKNEENISSLLKSITRLKRTKWIRLLYTHPAHCTDELINTISREDAICKYMDLPIQHISSRVLKAMNRNTSPDLIRRLIDKLRREIRGLAIRTTVMVGFPGETDSDFKELICFIKAAKFERLGAFTYSDEEGCASYGRRGQVPENIKRDRLGAVMELQQKISNDYNASVLGKTIEVLIDEKSEEEEGLYIGRSEFDAPSVDGQVFVRGVGLKPGDFTKVRITDTLEYDLVGEISTGQDKKRR